jgi:hypothetical protein
MKNSEEIIKKKCRNRREILTKDGSCGLFGFINFPQNSKNIEDSIAELQHDIKGHHIPLHRFSAKTEEAIKEISGRSEMHISD